MAQFDKQSIERIIRSVLRTERMIGTWPVRGKRGRNFPYMPMTLIIAQVNEAGDVTGADADFNVDNVSVLSGFFEDASITGVANTVAGSWSDNDYVICAYNYTDEQWEVLGGGGGASDGKVRMDAADPLAYLWDQMNDTGSYSSGSDILVHSQSVDSGAGNDKLRHFVDISAISGYDVAKKQALIHDTGTLKWMDISTC